jgi:hypothetical protein
MSKLSKADVDRFGLLGDPGFSEARNKAIIEKTIRDTEANHARKQKLIDEGLAERSDLMMSYIRSMLQNNKDMDITQYAGWETMKRLWGEARVRDLQERAEKLRQIKIN